MCKESFVQREVCPKRVLSKESFVPRGFCPKRVLCKCKDQVHTQISERKKIKIKIKIKQQAEAQGGTPEEAAQEEGGELFARKRRR